MGGPACFQLYWKDVITYCGQSHCIKCESSKTNEPVPPKSSRLSSSGSVQANSEKAILTSGVHTVDQTSTSFNSDSQDLNKIEKSALSSTFETLAGEEVEDSLYANPEPEYTSTLNDATLDLNNKVRNAKEDAQARERAGEAVARNRERAGEEAARAHKEAGRFRERAIREKARAKEEAARASQQSARAMENATPVCGCGREETVGASDCAGVQKTHVCQSYKTFIGGVGLVADREPLENNPASSTEKVEELETSKVSMDGKEKFEGSCQPLCKFRKESTQLEESGWEIIDDEFAEADEGWIAI